MSAARLSSALRRGVAAQLLGGDATAAAPPAAAAGGLTLNCGNVGCGVSRRRPPKQPSVPGPDGMAWRELSDGGCVPDKMLQHPSGARVRGQAARARHIDISSWDLAPGGGA